MTDTTPKPEEARGGERPWIMYASAIKARRDVQGSIEFVFNVWVHTEKDEQDARIFSIDQAVKMWPREEGYFDYQEVTIEVLQQLNALAHIVGTAPDSADSIARTTGDGETTSNEGE